LLRATGPALIRSVILAGTARGAAPDTVGTRKPVRRSRSGIAWDARAVATLALLVLVFSSAVDAHAQDEEHQGLQAGWAVDDLGNVNFTSSFSLQNRYMHEAEASWIRLNFRLGACYQDWTTTGCNGRTALQTYDEVVDIALSHGFQVLGLVGHEAWHGNQAEWTAHNAEHAGGSGDNRYLRQFGDHAATVLATHFKSKIRYWEVWNEPNAWTERDSAGRPVGGSFLYPSSFAWALTHAYEAIKLARPDAIVISGGLFGHDLGDPAILFARTPCPTGVPSGADYLCATYEMGLAHVGWQPDAFPFDHVGQHIYIDGGGPTSEEKLRFYLEDVRDAYLLYEGAESRKTTHITEFGWSTKDLSPEIQAQNLLTAYDTFRQVGYVARAYWFHAQDVPEANLFYGLTDASGLKKRAFSVYQDVAAYDSPSAIDDDADADVKNRTGRSEADAGPRARPVTRQAIEASLP
jgi:hypothetical protein